MSFLDRFRKKQEEKKQEETLTICAPFDGTVIPLKEIPDSVFSEGVLGFGCGIEPMGEEVYAPFDGEIIQVSDTKHAVGLLAAGQTEVLIHVGMDTVEMNGQGFDMLVKVGQKVKMGDKLLKFNIKDIKAAGHPITTAIVVCNIENPEEITVRKMGKICAGEELLSLAAVSNFSILR